MLLKLFLAFTLIPVAEIYILIKIGTVIGALNTVILVIVTALVGAFLAKLQGLETMLRMRSNLRQGIIPAEELLDAFLIMVAGIVLLTPGFLTDIAGLLLLLPQSRRWFKRVLRWKFEEFVRRQEVHFTYRP